MDEGAPDRVIIGTVQTPLGPFGAVLSERGLMRLTFRLESMELCEAWVRRWTPRALVERGGRFLDPLESELTRYFEGDLREFTLPVDLRGTPFQIQVWRTLLDIRYGEVRSYASVAAAIGRPRALRAVGTANGANPIPIIVPCHRVIGSDGTLTGYGGSLDLKERLLRMEGVPVSGAWSHRQQPLL